MGMAASQARLLALTARMTDVEFKAQQLQSQKLALATQKDEVYERYCEALDATRIRVAFNNGDGSRDFVNANFNTVCTYNPDRFRQYALQNNRNGLAIVSEEVKAAFDNFGGDRYTFAWKMLGIDHFNTADDEEAHKTVDGSGRSVGYNPNTNTQADFTGSDYGDFADGNILAMTEAEWGVYQKYIRDNDDSILEALFTEWRGLADQKDPPATTAEKKKALDLFRDTLYAECSNELYTAMNSNKEISGSGQIRDDEWTDLKMEFNYYVNLWDFLNECGGCVTVDSLYKEGEKGDDWFNNMVESGLVSIHEFDEEWRETSVATSTNGNYLRNEQDESDLKKAEAEYEHELDIINSKDKKFDTELNKLETEREALKKQMDSIKTVKKDNVEKSFGIFS